MDGLESFVSLEGIFLTKLEEVINPTMCFNNLKERGSRAV